MNRLPDEMIGEIMSHMNVQEIILLGASNHYLYHYHEKFLKNKPLMIKNYRLTILEKLNIRVDLTELNLHASYFTKLPKEIELLTQLKSLNLFFNHLTVIPKEIKSLKLLEQLDLSHNLLKTIPNEINELINLTHLSLAYNDLSELPNLNTLTKLEFLYLSCNNLKTFDIGMK